MERRTAFLDDAKESTRHAVGGHMLRHICQMVRNAHAITELCVVDDSGGVSSERQERIATAIYPSASLMNHSCDPTVINRSVAVAAFHSFLPLRPQFRFVSNGGTWLTLKAG